MIRRFFSLVVFLAIAGLLAASFFYSRDVYRFYIGTYYRTVLHTTVDDVKKKSAGMLESKKYGELEQYLRDVITVYPHDLEIIRLAGQYFIRMGKKNEGADLIVASLEGADLSREELDSILSELMQQGYYGDIVGIRKFGTGAGNGNRHFIYGKALYMMKNYGEAYDELQTALSGGSQDLDLLYYLGVTCDRLGKYDEAAAHLERAHDMAGRDRQISDALIEVYRKTGQYDKAAVLAAKRRR